MDSKKRIRPATVKDAAAILEIYAEYIKNTAVTFEIEVPTLPAFEERMERIMSGFPWLVCEIDGELRVMPMRQSMENGPHTGGRLTFRCIFMRGFTETILLLTCIER